MMDAILKQKAARTTALLTEYKERVNKIKPAAKGRSRSSKEIVILTGSTGTLGGYILRALLINPDVAHIYCLNRSQDGRKLQKERNLKAGLTYEIPLDRVTFWQSTFQASQLGLKPDQYETIRKDTTLIIHNAWPVNFNLPLDAFKPHLHGLLNFFMLATTTSSVCKVFYMSSWGSVARTPAQPKPTAEEVSNNITNCGSTYYIHSKFIAENLCDAASRQLDIPTLAARVGQVAGPVVTKGVWNPREWIPRLLLNSIKIGAIPHSLGLAFDRIDWVPVDLFAQIIMELAIHRDEGCTDEVNQSCQIFHILNPRDGSWPGLTKELASTMEEMTHEKVEVVPNGRWLSEVRQQFKQAMDAERGNPPTNSRKSVSYQFPAVPLLVWYEIAFGTPDNFNSIDYTKTMQRSPTLRNLQPVGIEWMKKWLIEIVEQSDILGDKVVAIEDVTEPGMSDGKTRHLTANL